MNGPESTARPSGYNSHSVFNIGTACVAMLLLFEGDFSLDEWPNLHYYFVFNPKCCCCLCCCWCCCFCVIVDTVAVLGDFLSLTYLLGAGNTMTILTPDDSTYNHGWVAVHDIESMVFRVLTCADAHIALATNVGAFDEAYEVIIGGFNNTMSSIRYNKNGQSMVNVTTKGVLSCFMPREFWISWRDGSINVGRGGEVFVNTFLSWRDLEPDEVNVMQVSSGNGNRAAWVFVESDCKSSESKVLEKSSILPLIINNQFIDRHFHNAFLPYPLTVELEILTWK